MRIDLITLFPEMCRAVLDTSILKRAQESGVVEVHVWDLRRWGLDKRGTVDDRPFGGGPGMVIMCEPVFAAVESVAAEDPRVAHRILLTPQGTTFDQVRARELAGKDRLILVAGHYEGFDERIRSALDCDQISVGDYVLTGGELPALVVIDAVVRLLPGALGKEESAVEESFSAGLLEYPHYTRPRSFRGMDVPEVLLSGDHGKIERWRHEQSLERTRIRRSDLLKKTEERSCQS